MITIANTATILSICISTTNTIIESYIHNKINITEDKDNPNNKINGKNAAKKKEKALQQKKEASIQRTESIIHDRFFQFLDDKSSNDTDSSSSSNCYCYCDLHHNCPKH